MDWRRHVIGLLALIFITQGVVKVAQADWSFSVLDDWSGMAFRTGVLLAAVWLALPEIKRTLARIPAWLLTTIGIGGLVVLIRPKLLLIVLPIVGALIALQIAGRALGLFRR